MRLIGTAASGIRAQQMALDILGNNLANISTPGFKEDRSAFAEALATEELSGDAKIKGTSTGAADLSVGVGVLYNATETDFKQGTLLPTDRSLDLGIDGTGFFQVTTPEGITAYTRLGNLQVDGSGKLADMQGNTVQPSISVPAGVTDLLVTSNGEVMGTVNGKETTLGQISLAGFQNPQGLLKSGDSLFIPTVNSGAPQVGLPGSTTAGGQVLGMIRVKTLEQSNVDLAATMTDLVQVQRAYQLNARLVQDGDQMWGMANALRR